MLSDEALWLDVVMHVTRLLLTNQSALLLEGE